jgi:hypothetical protein
VRLVVLRTSRIAHEDSKIKGLGLLRLQVRVKTSAGVLNVGSSPDYVNQAVRRLRAGLPAQCEAQEKQARAPMANLVGNHAAERQLEPSTARPSHSPARKNPKEEHPRQGLNNSDTGLSVAPEQNFGAALFYK